MLPIVSYCVLQALDYYHAPFRKVLHPGSARKNWGALIVQVLLSLSLARHQWIYKSQESGGRSTHIIVIGSIWNRRQKSLLLQSRTKPKMVISSLKREEYSNDIPFTATLGEGKRNTQEYHTATLGEGKRNTQEYPSCFRAEPNQKWW